jgi:2-dehydropantoate 2-reductase
MKIAIVGAGGVGSYYGANLQASGADVFFIARGAHYEAMKRDGLTIEGSVGAVKLDRVEVYNNAMDAPKADVALSCVKMYDAADAALACKTLLKDDGIAISLQNGIDGPDFLYEQIGEERTLAGSVIISAFISSPGVVKHADANQVFNIEKRDGLGTRFFETCLEAGFDAAQIEDPRLLLWKKFVRLVPISGVSILCRSSMGFVAANSHLRFVLQMLVKESVLVGEAAGVYFDDSIVIDVMARIDKAPYEFKPSLLLDIERERKNEASWLCGRIVELGRKLGVPTPYNDCVWATAQGLI